jgi:hypothetical protein
MGFELVLASFRYAKLLSVTGVGYFLATIWLRFKSRIGAKERFYWSCSN